MITAAPSVEMQGFIERLHVPAGAMLISYDTN